MSAIPDSRQLARAFACLALLALLLAPAVAGACPGCMESAGKTRSAVPVLLGFIGVPFVVFGGAVLAIHRRCRAAGLRRQAAIPAAVGPGRLIFAADPRHHTDDLGAGRPAA